MDFSEFKNRIIKNGLTREEFAVMSNTSLATINGWGANRKEKMKKETPEWVISWFELYEENRKLKHAVEVMKEL